MKEILLAVLSLILAFPGDVASQGTRAGDQPDQGQVGSPDQPVKEPPPPLFPKHRRGLYKSGLGPPGLDASPQSPPLEIDDPGVPDKGEYEINLTTQADLSKSADQLDLFLVDANYGLLYKVLGHSLPTQLKVEFPIAGARAGGQPFTVGVGAFTVGLKLNFYNNERSGLFLAFYPQVEFAAAVTGAVGKGLADPGQAVIVPLLVQKELSQVTLVVNGAVRQPIHDPARTTTLDLKVGVGRAVTRHLVLMTDARLESAFDLGRDRLIALNVGVMRSVGDKLVVYGKLGRSLLSDDGTVHTFVGCGLKVLTDSNKKSMPPSR
jgi:hypothetical protein